MVAAVEQQRPAGAGAAQPEHAGEQDDVVAAGVHGRDRAIERRQTAGDDRSARLPGLGREPVPGIGSGGCESLGQRLLAFAQHVDGADRSRGEAGKDARGASETA
jgi:hypothetical protein